MSAYQAALEHERPSQVKLRGDAGTFDRLVQDYLLAPRSCAWPSRMQRAYRLVIERWVHDDDIGHRLVSQMRRMHVERMLAKRAETPGAANDLLKKIRILMNFAIAHEVRRDDPRRASRSSPAASSTPGPTKRSVSSRRAGRSVAGSTPRSRCCWTRANASPTWCACRGATSKDGTIKRGAAEDLDQVAHPAATRSCAPALDERPTATTWSSW